MADVKLISRLCRREPGSLDALLHRYAPLMRYIIFPILSDERDREECLSDAAMRVWENIDKFDPNRGSFTAWLTVLTRNAALNRLERKQPEMTSLAEDMPAPEADPEGILLQKEREAALRKALHSLSDGERILFYRKYYYRQSTAQIAAETGTTERSIEGRLYRIRRRLQNKLKGEFL